MRQHAADRRERRLVTSLAIAAVATAVAMGLMFWARDAFQIRTLPERVMEWLLVFVSPETFEAGIGRFGAQAKVYALYTAVAGMALLLLALGTLLGQFASSPWTIWASGPALYLVAMGGIMPITGAGLFGSDLFEGPALVNASYLTIALIYATLLLLGRWRIDRAAAAVERTPGVPLADRSGTVARRAFLAGLAPAAASLLAVLWLGRRGGRSSLPLARVELTPGAAAPTAIPPVPTATAQSTSLPLAAPIAGAPNATTTSAQLQPTATPPLPPTPAPTIAPTAAPTAVAGLPVPRPMGKQIARDEYGAITAGGRQPGTLAELITRTENHYHVTKNAVSDPMIDADGWRLVLDGELQSPVQVDYRTLRQLPSIEIAKTLECISNYVSECSLVPYGCDLISTAAWKGVPLRTVLELAGGLKPGVVVVSLVGADEFTSTIPVEAALDPETLVAYEMNGEVLPYEHGYPARVLVPGRYGYKSAKWVRGIRPLNRVVLDWYAQRNWNKDGLVKTMSRIDVPASGAPLAPGEQRIAGIAYAADRGILKVEFSVDGGGSWQQASFLEPAPGKDAWVRWEGSFELSAGATTRLVARATDGAGQLQSPDFVLPAPDGASGWNSIQVKSA